MGSVPPSERIVVCEEVFELRVDLPNVVCLQCRQAGLEGTGAVPLRRLVRESLRMRPDRIVVGEVRGAECFDMLLALNSGAGGMTSVHANSAREALRKLVTLPLLAGENVALGFVEPTVAAVVDLVVFTRRQSGGRRVVEEILGVSEQVGEMGISAGALFRRGERGLEWTGEMPRRPERFTARGIDLREVLRSCWASSRRGHAVRVRTPGPAGASSTRPGSAGRRACSGPCRSAPPSWPPRWPMR